MLGLVRGFPISSTVYIHPIPLSCFPAMVGGPRGIVEVSMSPLLNPMPCVAGKQLPFVATSTLLVTRTERVQPYVLLASYH